MKIQKPLQSVVLISSAILSLSNALVASADDWPAWRGNSGSGYSGEQSFPLTWGPETNVHWKRLVPGVGYSSPIVWKDNIILTYADVAGQTRHVMAIDRESGNTLWDTIVATGPIESMHHDNSPASATPITDGNGIYVVFCIDGHLKVISLDFAGKMLWETTVGSFESAHGFSTALVLSGNHLLLSGLQDGSDAFIASLNVKDGSVVWKIPREKTIRSFSSPYLVEIQGAPAIILSGADQTIAYSCETGKTLWTLDGPASKTVSSIVVADELGLAFISGGRDGQFYAIRYDQIVPDRESAADRLIAWKQTKGIPYVTSPFYHDGLLHIVSDDGIYRSYNAETGELYANKRVGTKIDASMVGWGDKVYITDAKGKTTVIRNSAKYEVLAESDLKEPIIASPAMSNGDIVIRTTSHLYLIRETN